MGNEKAVGGLCRMLCGALVNPFLNDVMNHVDSVIQRDV